MIPVEQQATADLLRRLCGGEPVETHISAVFVGDDTVWKLRKAVRLSFLDFSTLAERRRTALRELDLNSGNAPGLYRDVVPVTRSPEGGLTLDGEGEPIDWVLRMNRVPAEHFLDRIAADGALLPELQDAMADGIAAAHGRLAPVHRDAPAAMRAVAEGNARAARAAGLDPAVVAGWQAAMLAALEGRKEWLQRRCDAGLVRRAHGDLHLGNMCLWQGRPVPFDALEFDEDLATIDLGYDLAFVLMDLDARAGRAAANRVMNRYFARTGDTGMVAGLPCFLSMRAMIRAHVAASRGQPAEAADYARRAAGYLAPSTPVLLAIGGLPGTGKTTLGRALAAELGAAPGAVMLRSDEIRKRRHGVPPEQRLPPAAYSPAASQAVFAELNATARAVLAAGHAVIADATFLDLGSRHDIAAAGTPFVGIWLQTPLALLEARVAARHGDASDADVAVLRRAADSDPGARDWLAVDASDGPAALASIRAAVAAAEAGLAARAGAGGIWHDDGGPV